MSPLRVILAALCGAVVALIGGPTLGAGAAGPVPQLELSSTTLVPGETVVISGQDWPTFQSVVATICGADAVSGTADCAVTDTATMVATHNGLLYSRLVVVVPPQPCPCVVLLTSTNTGLTSMIPVHIQGVATVPVHRLAPSFGKTLVITRLQVTGSWTVAASLGAPASRTVSFDLHNPGKTPVTPVLVGRWGSGIDPSNVITMPKMRPIGPGQTRSVVAKFNLRAFSMGDYNIKVQVQVVARPHVLTEWSTTTQWPIALFICLALLLVLLILLVRLALGRRHAKGPEQTVGATEKNLAIPVAGSASTGGPVSEIPSIGEPVS